MPPIEWVVEKAEAAATTYNINGLIIDVGPGPAGQWTAVLGSLHLAPWRSACCAMPHQIVPL